MSGQTLYDCSIRDKNSGILKCMLEYSSMAIIGTKRQGRMLKKYNLLIMFDTEKERNKFEDIVQKFSEFLNIIEL